MAEEKYVDQVTAFNISGIDRAAGWRVFGNVEGVAPNFMPTTTGTGETEIIGREVTLKSFHWQFRLYRRSFDFAFAHLDKEMAVRVVVVKDNQPKGDPTPVFLDIWDHSNDVGGNMLAFLKPSAMGRFRIVHDQWKSIDYNEVDWDGLVDNVFTPCQEFYSFEVNMNLNQKLQWTVPFLSSHQVPNNCNYLFYLLFAHGRTPLNNEFIQLDGILRTRFTDS